MLKLIFTVIFLVSISLHVHGAHRQRSSSTQTGTPAQWFDQCLDHTVDGGCDTTWSQRYWVRTDYYTDGSGSPIFFEFGAEGNANGQVDDDYFQEYGYHYNALLVVLEHRFYGESFPTTGRSNDDLKLLSSQQALADAANFIKWFTAQDDSYNGASWVTFGGSYGGSLAAWMRQKYPTLVKAAVASSGPLQYAYNFTGYMETISEVVKAIDPTCYNTLLQAFTCMESLTNGNPCLGYAKASEIPCALKQCCDIDFSDRYERENFFQTIAIGDAGWASNTPSSLVKKNCKILNKVTGSDPIKSYGKYLAKQKNGEFCYNRKLRDSPKHKHKDEYDYFEWQVCNEFGDFMSSDPKYGLFGRYTWDYLPYYSDCPSTYGDKYTPEYVLSRVDYTNDYYKGRAYDGTCTVFVNGAWDPWHTLSIYDSSQTSSANSVVFIPKSEHCHDMDYPSEGDKDLKKAQRRIRDQIGVYLNDPNC